ncbi:NAD-dependent epimerase/dehydratase family protein [Pectobacterium zantedeschiae]|uniref:NAD(P)-dependent oxidoreductase n=1 Tax=Pectobacterium zantedeschiae TaxID=2034769 RepID=A0A9X8JL54_9GAMM|nr:NAD(P)-dependent oxidoreductase [Pectobacterium zantedeschiae]RYC38505.1 NAD(P)-dependent oxidoreductase [Pectobacterium zantedeschiae]RYC41913.1 NAD(P)-dependent oxidoreductase [Pectobacterium zantedeschiae]RYC45149.1 NAD(P)-dependent oxidoreductase [Pectobacterium zantedeschiae]
MKKVLITGITGFIGSHVAEALIKEGFCVIGYKRSTSDLWRLQEIKSEIIFYDIDRVPLDSAFSQHKIDYMIHLATLYRKFDNENDFIDQMNSNVTFPTALLGLCEKYRVKGFINTGTFFELDCSQQPVSVNASEKAFNFYAKTKLAFQHILKTYQDSVPSITFRIFSPYGEKDNTKLIPTVIQKSLRGDKVSLSDGLQKIDPIYISDVVSAYISGVKSFEGERGYRVYNLGSGRAISIRELISIIEQHLCKTVDKEWGEPSENDIPIAYADISTLQSELNWSPKYTIHQGISRTIDYYKDLEG